MEPIITCPNCKTEIKLTESLAAPLIESTRREFEQKLTQRNQEITQREAAIRQKEGQLVEAKSQLNEQITLQVQERLKKDRKVIEEEAKKQAQMVLGADLNHKSKEISDLQEILKSREAKLAEAQKVQAELIKKERALDDAKREMDLMIEKRIQEGLEVVRGQARQEAETTLKLKVSEKEQTILSMQKQIEELKRRAEQGSQQLQGEVQELELEEMLRNKFPTDRIEPVPKGEFGGDVLQRVLGMNGVLSGTILWESKRTKNWSEGWLSKLREDQRAAKAEIAILVSQALPVGIETFELIEGIWITHPKTAFPVAMVLRQSLLEITDARHLSEGQQTKMEIVYQYLTGHHFRHRITAIVDAFSSMKEDLDKERKVITKQWEKRGKQIECIMDATVGMYGDLQGIAGKSLQEIEGLEFKVLGFDQENKENQENQENQETNIGGTGDEN